MQAKAYHNLQAEREADEAALQFMDSPDVIGDMSRAYGYDFSRVRIHTDETAAQRTAALGSDAFASGNDVFFGRGVFQPHDPVSRGLLAHELTHTIQQGDAGGVQEQAPMGAPQCGWLDKIRALFGRGKKRPDIQRAGPAFKGPAANQQHPWEVREREKEKQMKAIRNVAVPAIHPGAGPQQEDLDAYNEVLTKQNYRGSPMTFLERSNHDFHQQPDTPVAAASQSLIPLGFRDNEKSGDALRKIKSSWMLHLPTDLSQYMINLGKNVDLDNILSRTSRVNIGSKHMEMNEETALIAKNMLSMVGGYATSEAGQRYMEGMGETLGQADVFQTDKDKHAMDLKTTLFNDLLLRDIGASAGHLKIYENIHENQGHGKTQMMMKVNQLLMQLPQIANMSVEERSNLPQTVLPLLDEYQEILARLHQG